MLTSLIEIFVLCLACAGAFAVDGLINYYLDKKFGKVVEVAPEKVKNGL